MCEFAAVNPRFLCPMQTDDDLYLRLGPTLDFVRSLPSGHVLAGCVTSHCQAKPLCIYLLPAHGPV